jgi:hypothetical protein
MKDFKTYEDMEDGDYEPMDETPTKNSLRKVFENQDIPTGPMGEIYLSDGMVITKSGEITKE